MHCNVKQRARAATSFAFAVLPYGDAAVRAFLGVRRVVIVQVRWACGWGVVSFGCHEEAG